MAIQLFIGGVDRTDYLAVNSGKITRDINGRASFSGTLRQIQRAFRPSKGQTLEVQQDGETRFGGFIYSIRTYDAAKTRNLMEFGVRCIDYNQIANRRLVNAEFEGGLSVGTIVQHIVTAVLGSEGVTANHVSASTIIEEAIEFRYETAASCLNKLSAITGDLWYIDFDKDLHFGPLSSSPANAAPFSVTDESEQTDEGLSGWFDLEVEEDDSEYRNRQYVRTEAQLGLTYDESFTIVQNGQDFIPTSTIPIEILEVMLNGNPLTVGLHVPGTTPDSGYDLFWADEWMGLFTYGWAVGDPSQGLTLNAGDVVAFSYRGSGRNVVMAEDTAEQAARAALEGGSGIWEAIEEQRNIESMTTLTAIAQGRLRQFADDVVKAKFKTDWRGVEPGQVVQITVTRFDIDEELLIERVDSDWVAARQDFMRHTVYGTTKEPASNGSGGARPESYFEKVVEMARIGQTPAQVAGEPRTLTLVYGDTLAVGEDVLDEHPKITAGTNRKFRISSHHANLKTVATGTAVILVAEYSANKSSWTQFATITIAVGDYEADSDVLTVADVPDDVYVRLNITQVGSTGAGGGLEWKFIGEVI